MPLREGSCEDLNPIQVGDVFMMRPLLALSEETTSYSRLFQERGVIHRSVAPDGTATLLIGTPGQTGDIGQRIPVISSLDSFRGVAAIPATFRISEVLFRALLKDSNNCFKVEKSRELGAIVKTGDVFQMRPLPSSGGLLKLIPMVDRVVVQVLEVGADAEVVFAPPGFELGEETWHGVALKSLDALREGSVPEQFTIPVALFRQYMKEELCCQRTPAAPSRPESPVPVGTARGAVVMKVSQAVPAVLPSQWVDLPAPPAEEQTRLHPLALLDQPLVGSGRVTDIPLPDLLDVLRDDVAERSAMEQALTDLENVLNLRPDQIDASRVRPFVRILTTDKHLVKSEGRARVVAVNRRLVERYNSGGELQGMKEAIDQINEFLALFSKR